MLYRQESNVASYCRSFPVQFEKALGAKMFDGQGHPYLDFLSGCGSVNYGHNNPKLKSALLEYIMRDGVTISMDLLTDAKKDFLETVENLIFKPRSMEYKFMFPGPAGTNTVEAAVKIARKLTGRRNVIAFTNGFHGCTLGALGVTGSRMHRGSTNPIDSSVERFPFDGYLGPDVDTAEMLDRMLDDPSSGVDLPAAIILETVQGEGGLNVASSVWLKRIEEIAHKYGALLIVDEIQTGCGRCGDFFSFEAAGISPDVITMAKSISGFGLPMSLVLVKPDKDVFEPGEHTGTFRGNCHAFVTGAEAIRLYWTDDKFHKELRTKISHMDNLILEITSRHQNLQPKGRGMMRGIKFESTEINTKVRRKCFDLGLILEACGPMDEVMKFLPPLTVSLTEIDAAFEIIGKALVEISSNESET